MSDFPGFPPALFDFLDDLREHNDRDWFKAHRDRYEASWLAPAQAFVEAMNASLADFEPAPHGEPRVNGSIWRIQRDTRFSQDKAPYKANLAMQFWYGDDKKIGPSYYISLDPESCVLGAGVYQMDPPTLARYRDAVAGSAGAPLQDHVDALLAAGWTVGGDATKRVPRGYDADHPRAELLKHKGMYVMAHASHDDLTSARAISAVTEAWRAAEPFARWWADEVYDLPA